MGVAMGGRKNQKRVAARARSPLFSPFFRQLFQEKKKKRKAKRQMTSGAQTTAFPPLFPLLFIFLKSKRKSKEQRKSPPLFLRLFSFSFRVPGLFVYLSLPGWCLNQLRGGGLRSLLVCGKGARGLFSEGRGEQKEGGCGVV